MKLIPILKSEGYIVYDKPYQLNIVGIRSSATISNRFDDELHVFFRDGQLNWQHFTYSITTDPGTYWLEHPLNVDGTAILKSGQYINAYAIGLHRGQYKALVQFKPVTVIRDYNRDAVLDFMNGKESTGLFGINIHHASQVGTTNSVDKWSAGCQVFEKISAFNELMSFCEKHRQLYGNQFTYTLIDYRAIKKKEKGGLPMG